MEDEKGILSKVSEGYRYGWIINLIATAIMFAYFMGQLNASIDGLKKDVERLKTEVFDLSHITRGMTK